MDIQTSNILSFDSIPDEVLKRHFHHVEISSTHRSSISSQSASSLVFDDDPALDGAEEEVSIFADTEDFLPTDSTWSWTEMNQIVKPEPSAQTFTPNRIVEESLVDVDQYLSGSDEASPERQQDEDDTPVVTESPNLFVVIAESPEPPSKRLCLDSGAGQLTKPMFDMDRCRSLSMVELGTLFAPNQAESAQMMGRKRSFSQTTWRSPVAQPERAPVCIAINERMIPVEPEQPITVTVADAVESTQINCSPQPAAFARQPATNDIKEIPSIHLRLCTPLEPLWYAERPFPPFKVEVVHLLALTRARWLHSRSHDLKLSVDMVDGNGVRATEKLKCIGPGPLPVFPVLDGLAVVSGLRFSAVSSKYGGGFRLVLSLLHHNIPVATVTTDAIQVLSYRLYHAPKVSFDQLKPDDSVSKMKGIGSQYAKRFQSLGIEKVAQLAALDLSNLSEPATRNLLGNLRKDRGTMTLAKLTEYIQQAAEIVSRYPHTPSVSSPTHTVARRAFSPQMTVVTPIETTTSELRNSIIARVMLNLESMARS